MTLSTIRTAGMPAVAGGARAKQHPYGKAIRYGEEELQELREALEQGSLFYSQGKKVFQLEQEFARQIGAAHAVACSSGTAAIHAALIALGISPGDEVITSPITDMGTIVPILFQGAVPVFADLTPSAGVLDIEAVADRMTARTRAVIAVHLWGSTSDMEGLRELCSRRDVALIEDCAQAFGCTYQGRPVGTMGRIGCFSLNEFKHISCGDGGLAVTDDADLAQRLRLATDKGYNRTPGALERQAAFLAGNYRMTELQAAVARAQLPKLDGIVARRRRWAGALSERLQGAPGLMLPQAPPGCSPSWWFYMLRVRPEILGVGAGDFAEALRAEEITAAAHYIGRPIYRYPIFQEHSAFARGEHPYCARDYSRESCPEAEAILETAVVLPVNEAFSEIDLDEVAEGVLRLASYYAGGGRAGAGRAE